MHKILLTLKSLILLTVLSAVVFSGCQQKSNLQKFPALSGEYFGQKLPGAEPEVFAESIISTGMYTRDITMTPDGKEIYYCVTIGGFTYSTILVTKLKDGNWTRPEVAPFASDPEIMNFEPFISPDGEKFFFLSNRADTANGDTTAGDQDIWVMDRIDDGWSEPYNIGAPVNSDGAEFFPSVTKDGTIYFTRAPKGRRLHHIYRSKLVDGKYTEPEKLPAQVNTGVNRFNAFVAPDESYIIVPAVGHPVCYGGTDYYISFRNEDDTWTEAINMGDKVNSASPGEFSPYVSPDGKFFFFMTTANKQKIVSEFKELTYDKIIELYNSPQNGNPNIYWIDASFIEDLRKSVQ